MPLITLGILILFLIFFGVLEYQLHLKALNTIPLRIHVNGTRGKSSVTRLIAAGLREAGMKTYAKVTGTAPRVIDELGIDRIIHRLRLPSIGEQVKLVDYFSKKNPQAIVIECMAVQPHYQWISEHKMIKSHIGVITNVRPDHLDEMGPTDDDVAKSLCNTVPCKATIVTSENEKDFIIQEVAENNDTKYIQSNSKNISQSDLDKFSYMEHPSNIALALDVCKIAGVDKKIAIKGMQKVKPDEGALVLWKLTKRENKVNFVNGMAANDPVSTKEIWDFISEKYLNESLSCIFFNSRDDRPDRTRQMIELTLKDIKPNYFIIRGDKIENQIKHYLSESSKINIKVIGLDEKYDSVIKHFFELPPQTLVYAIGNQVGAGQEILNRLSEYKSYD